MKLFRMAALLVSFVLLIPVTSQGQTKPKAPNFVLNTQDGKSIELKKLAGKVVVLNFWATWCPPCRAEIPGMLEVYSRYKGKGLEIVGVSLDREGWDKVKPFIERMKISYPVVVGDGRLVDAYGGIDAIPTTFVVDKRGNIVERHVGYLDKQRFEDLVKKLL